nr:hypothetical protein TQ38_28510 [Novosphingobium sp. P6W]
MNASDRDDHVARGAQIQHQPIAAKLHLSAGEQQRLDTTQVAVRRYFPIVQRAARRNRLDMRKFRDVVTQLFPV